MIVLITKFGLPIWSYTSKVLRGASIVWLGRHMKVRFSHFDFGVGSELAFECPGCGRWCPHETASVDHIVPRTGLQFEVSHDPLAMPKCISGGGAEKYKLQDFGKIELAIEWSIEFLHVTCEYSLCSGFKSVKYKFSHLDLVLRGREFRCSIPELLENDLHNLQFMCASCNSKKSNKTITSGQFRPRFTGANEFRVV